MYIHGILHLEMIILWLISCKLKIILKQTSDIIEQHSGPIRYDPPPPVRKQIYNIIIT